MRAIKEATYKNMSVEQRVIASMEAIARGDKNEKSRLEQTCPKFHYTMTDYRYCGKINALRDMALAVEHDIRGCILAFFDTALFYEREPRLTSFKSLIMRMELLPEHAEDILGIRKAWHDFLRAEGIASAVAEIVFADMRDHITAQFIRIAERLDLEPHPYTTQLFSKRFRDYYDDV